MAKITGKLKKGVIPKELREDLGIIEPTSIIGREFQDEIEKFVQLIYPQHDFKKHPIRFVLMAKVVNNAFHFSDAKPPLIGIGTGVFYGEKAEETFDGVANYVLHEGLHRYIQDTYGVRGGGYLEEALAEYWQLEVLQNSGFNPRRVLEHHRRRLRANKGQERDRSFLGVIEGSLNILKEIVDPHPVAETMVPLLEGGLTVLEVKRGRLNDDYGPLEAHHPFVRLAQAANERWAEIEKKPEQKTDQALVAWKEVENKIEDEKLSTQKKFQALIGFFKSIRSFHQELLFPMSDVFLNFFIRKAESKEYQEELRQLQDLIVDRLTEVGTAKEKTPDNVWDFRDSPDQANEGQFGKFYEIISRFFNPPEYNPGIDLSVPIGRLENIATKIRKFLNAKKPTDIRQAAQDFLKVYSKERFFQAGNEGEISREINWPRFSFPREGQKVPWNPHVLTAIADQAKNGKNAVLEVLCLLGILDPRLIPLDIGFTRKFITDEDISYFPTPQSGGRTFSSICMNEKGQVISREEVGKGIATIEDWRKNFFAQEVENLFAGFPKSGRKKSLTVKEEQIVEQIVSTTPGSLWGNRLIALPYFDRDLDSFITANFGWLENEWAQDQMIEAFEGLRKRNPKKYRKLVREFFKFPQEPVKGTSTHSPFEFIESADFSTWYGSLAKDFDGVFSPGERLWAIGQAGCLDKLYKLAADNFQVGHAMGHIRPVLHQVIPGYPKNEPVTWGEFLKVISGNEFRRIKGHEKIALLEGMLLFRRFQPTPSQIQSFIEVVGGELFATRESDLVPGFRRILETQGQWGKSLNQITLRWRRLYEANLLSSITVYVKLGEIVADIKKVRDVSERRILLENLLYESGKTSRWNLRGAMGQRILDPALRRQIIDLWADSMCGEFGLDDSSVIYQKRIRPILSRLHARVNAVDRMDMLNQVAKKLQTQRAVTHIIEAYLPRVSKETLEESRASGIIMDSLAKVIQGSKKLRKATMEYLLAGKTPYVLNWYVDLIIQEIRLTNAPDFTTSTGQKISKMQIKREEILFDAELIYKNFWTSDLGVRALIARNLLVGAEVSSPQEEREVFDYVMEQAFPKWKKHSEEAQKLTRAYYQCCSEHSKYYALAVLMIATEKAKETHGGIGESAVIFCEMMGPAPNKVGQHIGSYPNTPEDIRKPFERLKIRSDEPSRWELWKWIDELVPEEERRRYRRIGRVRGAASFFVSLEVELLDGTVEILQLLRPFSKDRAAHGFDQLRRMNEELGKEDAIYDAFGEIIGESEKDAEVETNIPLSFDQFRRMRELYQPIRVLMAGETYTFGVPHVKNFGDGWRRVERVSGVEFMELPAGEHRKKIAKVILAVELNHILAGYAFDNDRHGANVLVDGRMIGHIDPGGMMAQKPTDRELKGLSNVLYDAFLNSKDGFDFANSFFNEVRKIKETTGQVPSLLSRVQKTLISLGDYRRELSNDELEEVFISAAQGMHPVMEKTLRIRAMQDMANLEEIPQQILRAQLIRPKIEIHRGQIGHPLSPPA